MRAINRRALPAFTVLALGYLLIPIAVMIVFSFNLPQGKFNFAWNQFSLDAWFHPFDWPGLGDALRRQRLAPQIFDTGTEARAKLEDRKE